MNLFLRSKKCLDDLVQVLWANWAILGALEGKVWEDLARASKDLREGLFDPREFF